MMTCRDRSRVDFETKNVPRSAWFAICIVGPEDFGANVAKEIGRSSHGQIVQTLIAVQLLAQMVKNKDILGYRKIRATVTQNLAV